MDVIVNGEKKEEFPPGSKGLSKEANYYHAILGCLGYDPEHLPLAGLLKLYHQLEGQWLIASPVHWEASHNDAMLIAAGDELELSDSESRLWFAAVADFLKADGFTPVYHDAHTWLFNIDDKPAIHSQVLETMMHKSLMPIISSLDSSYFWQRLFTEMQMYLSAHPLNLKRPDLTINGLWFWGEGDFKLEGLRKIVSDDQILLKHSSSVSPLTPVTEFSKNDLLIINDPTQIELCFLEQKLKKNTVNWYWSNCSYTCKPTHWWSKFWR
ncbi:MAG: hypothetical protein H0U73_08255 [Tatlockia sp.]|nr:hypothetical protein [Tatlockia sp.]